MKARAKAVLPSLTHLSTHTMPDGYSQFFARGEGCRVWDVDGKEYIDFMSSYGPISVGHRHPAVQRAVEDQMARGDCLSGPSERMVELAEKLVELNAWSSWATFQKNGTDATTLAVRYARAHTGRRALLRAPGAYHGGNQLWSGATPGNLPEDSAHQLHYNFNDLSSVHRAVEQADGDFAAIIVSAFRWDFFHDLEMPTQEFLQGVRALCDEHDAVLIMDDIRSAMRIDIRGTWHALGVNPDLMCQCKGIANGQPLATVVGVEKMRSCVTKVVATGSFWANAVPFAAALATIDVLQNGGIARMRRAGQMLRDGLYAQAAAHKLCITHSGPVQMPLLIFEADRAGAHVSPP
jgi:glutamate-1-semialdehyde 2,1-aminomutase